MERLDGAQRDYRGDAEAGTRGSRGDDVLDLLERPAKVLTLPGAEGTVELLSDFFGDLERRLKLIRLHPNPSLASHSRRSGSTTGAPTAMTMPWWSSAMSQSNDFDMTCPSYCPRANGRHRQTL